MTIVLYHNIATYCFGVLGVIRGIQYDRHRHVSLYRKPWMVTNSLLMGFCGGVIYYFPICMPFTIYRELYRFEVWVRNLPIDDNYYDIL